jgi:hypothetical protein
LLREEIILSPRAAAPAKGLLLLASILAAAGCTYIEVVNHYDLEVDQLERYKAIKIVDPQQRAQPNYRTLGEIRGLSCAKILGQSPSEQDAMDQVRLRAAQAGATAMSPPVCEWSGDLDWKNNCWKTIICASEILVETEPVQGTGT